MGPEISSVPPSTTIIILPSTRRSFPSTRLARPDTQATKRDLQESESSAQRHRKTGPAPGYRGSSRLQGASLNCCSIAPGGQHQRTWLSKLNILHCSYLRTLHPTKRILHAISSLRKIPRVIPQPVCNALYIKYNDHAVEFGVLPIACAGP
jgi:hypothetical protein